MNDPVRRAERGRGSGVDQANRWDLRTTLKYERGPANPFSGRWRITWMESWDQDFVDAEVERFFEFGKGGLGEFQFGYVSGQISYELSDRGGTRAVEFSWEGQDEMNLASGRGWAVLDSNGINGKIFFH